jgi:hypothetical protein
VDTLAGLPPRALFPWTIGRKSSCSSVAAVDGRCRSAIFIVLRLARAGWANLVLRALVEAACRVQAMVDPRVMAKFG